MNGKGSKRRPCLINRKDFEKNWDMIFNQTQKNINTEKKELIILNHQNNNNNNSIKNLTNK